MSVQATCGHEKSCLDTHKAWRQLAVWLEAPMERLGSLMAGLLETSAAGSFHPSEAFQENRLILSQNKLEKEM